MHFHVFWWEGNLCFFAHFPPNRHRLRKVRHVVAVQAVAVEDAHEHRLLLHQHEELILSLSEAAFHPSQHGNGLSEKAFGFKCRPQNNAPGETHWTFFAKKCRFNSTSKLNILPFLAFRHGVGQGFTLQTDLTPDPENEIPSMTAKHGKHGHRSPGRTQTPSSTFKGSTRQGLPCLPSSWYWLRLGAL